MTITKLLALILFFLPFILHIEGAEHDIRSKKDVLTNTARISPEPFFKVVNGQLKALRAKDLEKAYKEFTSTAFRKYISFDDFKKLISKYQPLSNNKDFQFSSFYIDNDIATFAGELLSEKEETISVEYDFISENEEWKIEGIQIYTNELPKPADNL